MAQCVDDVEHRPTPVAHARDVPRRTCPISYSTSPATHSATNDQHPVDRTRQRLPTSSPSPTTVSAPLDSLLSQTPSKIVTELPVPLSGTSRRPGRATTVAGH